MRAHSLTRALLLVAATAIAAFSQTGGYEKLKRSNDIAVVVNANNPVQDLNSDELRRILNGERQFWNGNLQITLVLKYDDSPETQVVLMRVLRASSADFAKIWTARVFRGEAAKPPLQVPSSGLASQVVRDYRGGLGFVAARDLPPDLKVLKVDGKLPGDPRYLLSAF
jgi:ABC-type phosphate transport system substrate-binding protein